jgi:hypothetical protein
MHADSRRQNVRNLVVAHVSLSSQLSSGVEGMTGFGHIICRLEARFHRIRGLASELWVITRRSLEKPAFYCRGT